MMRKTKCLALIFLAVCLILVFAGCGRTFGWLEGDAEDVVTTEVTHGVYWMDLGETKLMKVPYEIEGASTEEMIGLCIEGLQKTPEDNAYKSVLSGDARVVDYTYQSGNKLATIYFDESYNKQSKAREILVRAAVVKTLTQFCDEIHYVSFVIGTEPLMAKDGTLLMMRGKDFVNSISGSMEYVREDYVTLYFASEDGTKLQAEDVIVKYLSRINLETAVVNSLISGPFSDGLKPVLSPEIVVNKVNVKEGVCYVDLNKKFLERVESQSFELNIYSIVNSLTQIAGITRVQFLIDGVIFDGAVEGTRIDGMFEKNMALVYRPESKAPESLIELPKSDDALKKDIEQQLKENGAAQKQETK